MWALAGMAVVIVAAVHSCSYMLWLWSQGERLAAAGVAILTMLSLALPVYTAISSNP